MWVRAVQERTRAGEGKAGQTGTHGRHKAYGFLGGDPGKLAALETRHGKWPRHHLDKTSMHMLEREALILHFLYAQDGANKLFSRVDLI